MAVEQMRGCGYRVVGGLYLCGQGQSMHCDRLPYELELCPVCGSGVKFTRGWTWLDWAKYAGDHEGCRDAVLPMCRVCIPHEEEQPYGLLWVGEASYTPTSFIQEALIMGVSRRIPTIPHKLKLGETWVLCAHKKACGERRSEEAPFGLVGIPGVFYAFRPTSLELLIWQSEAKLEYLEDLAKRNITPVVIPDGDEDHNPETKTKMSDDDREVVVQSNKIALLRQKIGK